MNKAQSQILGTVLITSILLGLTGTAYLWGKPLIDKGTDKNKFDTLLFKMKEIENAITSVSTSGGSKTVEINLQKEEKIRIENGEIILETRLTLPLIQNSVFTPLNTQDLPTRTPIYVARLTGSGSGNRTGTVELKDATYNIHTYIDASCEANQYCKTCVNNICGGVDSKIVINSEDYEIKTISTNGDLVYLIGENIENIGVLGRDETGIISGKSEILGNNAGLLTTLKISYRGMRTDSGLIYRNTIQCSTNCFISETASKIRISRTNIERDSNSINTLINVNVLSS